MPSLSYILAIEPDPRQSAALTRVARDRVGADLTVVDSKDAAIASINKRVPDLILVTALFSPREEENLVAHLRTLEGAEHLQTLTIPLLAAPANPDDSPRRGLFGRRKKSADMIEMQGCDPVVFAEQISGYLKTAADLKAAAEADREYAARAPRPEPEAAPETAAVADTASDSIFAPAPPAKPLAGYTADTLGELLSKEESIDPYAPLESPAVGGSSGIVSATPIAEPAVVEAAPMVETPAVDQAPPPEPPRPAGVRPSIFQRPPRRVIPDVPKQTPVEEPSPVAVAEPRLGVEEGAPASVEEVVPIPVVDPTPAGVAPMEAAAAAVVEPAAIRAQEPPAPVRLVQRLPPLAMWARFQSAAADAPASEDHGSPTNDSDPLGVLRVPAAIATISYPTGCRIWRVTARTP